MSRINSGKQILRDAEQAIQRLLAAAAIDGDYCSLPPLMEWAHQIAVLAGKEDESATPAAPSPSKAIQRLGRSRRQRPKKRKSTGYPRFIRDEDCLVKIGWSKSDSSEYEHKAAKDAVEAVVSSLSRAGRRGKRFSMEALLPFKKPDESPLPDYQSYLILAWLRASGLVVQHGRLGYTIPSDILLPEAVKDCWLRLAERTYSDPDTP